MNNYTQFEHGIQKDVYIKWPVQEGQNPQLNELNSTSNPYLLGYVWPEGKVVFPDFFNPNAQNWWIDEITKYYQSTLTFDG